MIEYQGPTENQLSNKTGTNIGVNFIKPIQMLNSLFIAQHTGPISMMKPDSNGTHIWTYLISLTESQSELGGMAICPFLKQYISHIQVIQGFERIESACRSVMEGTPAVVLWDNNQPTERIVDEWQQNYPEDLEILWMDSQSHEPPLKIKDYTFRSHDLIIVQDREQLEQARQRLEQTDYYKYWRHDQ